MPQSFGNTSAVSITAYMQSQFYYWTEDEIARNFRRILTLEQHRSPEMTAIYQKVLASGSVNYIEDLFREMIKLGIWRDGSLKEMAVESYATFYLLLSISDGALSKAEKENFAALFTTHMERLMKNMLRKKFGSYRKSNESCS